tara:strand:- start:425 stop:961 length:537 start_codon:yes stop_codon:yes gene_type:complete
MSSRRKAWQDELAEFIVEGHKNAWAAEGGEIDPVIPGIKSMHHNRGEWDYYDNFGGYFKAPGWTVVNFRGQPAWSMSYFGMGQNLRFYDSAKPTFDFLKKALLEVTPDMPYRGPARFTEEDLTYTFRLLRGDLEDFTWAEEIVKRGSEFPELQFSQEGAGGIILARDEDRKPVIPWDL